MWIFPLIISLSNFRPVRSACIVVKKKISQLLLCLLIWMVSLEGFHIWKLLLLLHNRWSHPHCLPSNTWRHAVPAQCQSICCQTQLQARAMPGSLLTLRQYGCLQNSAWVWCLAHVAYKYSYRICDTVFFLYCHTGEQSLCQLAVYTSQ